MINAQKIRDQRNNLNLTVIQAAVKAGVCQTTWTEIETAQQPNPRLYTLSKIAEALEKPVSYFLEE